MQLILKSKKKLDTIDEYKYDDPKTGIARTEYSLKSIPKDADGVRVTQLEYNSLRELAIMVAAEIYKPEQAGNFVDTIRRTIERRLNEIFDSLGLNDYREKYLKREKGKRKEHHISSVAVSFLCYLYDTDKEEKKLILNEHQKRIAEGIYDMFCAAEDITDEALVEIAEIIKEQTGYTNVKETVDVKRHLTDLMDLVDDISDTKKYGEEERKRLLMKLQSMLPNKEDILEK